ncbi:unnamed protein product [Anisakis simplex]|nr:unnamed protein product [Anisakis simplex]
MALVQVESGDTSTPEKAKMEYIRLSLPVKCSKMFTGKDKEAIMRSLHDIQDRQHVAAPMIIRAPTIPKEFEDSKEPTKVHFYSHCV